jgi:hypothetical protein
MAKNIQKIGLKSTKSRFHHNLVNWGYWKVSESIFFIELDKVPLQMASPQDAPLCPNHLVTQNGQKRQLAKL